MGWNVSKELRRSRRVAAALSLRYVVAGHAADSTKSVVATTTSVSYGGLSFITPVSLPVRTPLVIELTLPGRAEDLRIEGVVVRIVSEPARSEGFEYGVQFTEAALNRTLEHYVRAIDIVPLLEAMVQRGASALHLCAFTPPVFRIQRALVPESDEVLSPERLEEMIFGVLSAQRKRQLLRDKEIDFPLTIPEIGRWRVNVHYAKGCIEAVFRSVNREIPTISELDLPNIVPNLALSDGGLIVVTGPSASGKTTTLAALVGHINRETSRVIVTIEDPVEYIHDNIRSIVKQREAGADTHSVLHGLRHALRQNPDVIVVSDVRDRQTMDILLRAAESGFLVLTTMHTPNAVDTIERIASWYPREDRSSALHAVAASLRGIIAQRLFHTKTGLALAAEVLVSNEGIRNAIRMDRIDQIHNLMTGISGSQPLEISLRNLILRGLITFDVAAPIAREPERLKKMVMEHRA